MLISVARAPKWSRRSCPRSSPSTSARRAPAARADHLDPDTKSILAALSEWGRIEKTRCATEYVGLDERFISSVHGRARHDLRYLSTPRSKTSSRRHRRTSTGRYLARPLHAHDILGAIRREISNTPPGAQKPVVITDMELRRFVRKMVELEFPVLTVLSYQELAPELNVQPVGRITMRPVQPPPSANLFPPAEQSLAKLPALADGR